MILHNHPLDDCSRVAGVGLQRSQDDKQRSQVLLVEVGVADALQGVVELAGWCHAVHCSVGTRPIEWRHATTGQRTTRRYEHERLAANQGGH